jgi:YidC/Oxa1 family membrane protein insertase
MEKRAILAIILSVVVLVFFQLIFAPKHPVSEGKPETAKPEPEVGKKAPIESTTVKAEKRSPVPAGEKKRVEGEREEKVVVNTKLFRAVLSNRGARLFSFTLKGYLDDEERPLELVPEKLRMRNRLPLALYIPGDPQLEARMNSALYTVDRSTLDLTRRGMGQGTIRFSYSDGEGHSVSKVFWFTSDGYLIRVKLELSPELVEKKPYLMYGPGFANHPLFVKRGFFSGRFAPVVEAGVALSGGKVYRLRELKGEEGEPGLRKQGFSGEIDWVGIGDNYFAALLLPDRDFSRAMVIEEQMSFLRPGGEREKVAFLSTGVPVGKSEDNLRLFLGPKDYQLLSNIDGRLKTVVNFGWFGFIAKPLLFVLNYLYRYTGNYGLAIIIMTIMIKLIFHPLSLKSYISMQKMQKIQPKIKSLQAKYKKMKKDPRARERLNQELLELYRREGVSPFGGCLPMLLQIPVLFSMYRLLMVAIEMRGAPFILWITDLSQKDPYYITPLIMGATMFIQQRITPAAGDPAQARMMRMMPIIFTFLFLSFPSGLVIYWLTNNLLSIGEQYIVKRRLAGSSPKGKESAKKVKDKKGK